MFAESAIERKKLAIEILQILQNQQKYQQEIESYFLKIIAEESSESLRREALMRIKFNENNVNFLAHRIKDVSLNIRSLLMDKLINSDVICVRHLDKNSLYFIIYNLIFIEDENLQ